ncbi:MULTISPECIES: TonB-dependent receptor [unclassified Parabacteroides]|uniref:SusC/RagA family TonB-linked outer membrane protein n=1 Tax=unclassified Parabacteroides TaxID=2649774 RepID=UPI00247678F8|nr:MULTISPECIES: TonB-dependent receptor [unclassified Parabacteroides]
MLSVQQSKTVQGTVVDAEGYELPGVNVVEKGTTNGTTTDVDGKFSLTLTGSNPVLQFSYVGYQQMEVTVGNQGVLTIRMQEDSQLMDEVVVIGYGTQKKGDVTSAISSVKKDDFIQGKVSDAADLIKGKVAGLVISKGSGDPNSGSSIRLRGVITLTGSNSPLVLVDGIPGDMGTVAPENIASVDVLKDASAAAIYGTRGANGVILITTVEGKRGQQASINYSGYLSLSQFGKKHDFMGPEEIRQGYTDFTDMGYDTDWLDAVTRTSFSHNHNVNIHGGTEKTTYSADVTYRDDQGVILNTYSEDLTINMNLSHWFFNDMLKVSFNLLKGQHTNSANNATYVYRQAIIHNPTEPIKDADGNWYENFGRSEYVNPLALINERIGDYETDWSRMTGSLTFEPIKGWQNNLRISRRTWSGHDKGYYTSDHPDQRSSGHTGYAYHSYGKSHTDELEFTSNYQKTIGKHRFEALVGYSYQYSQASGFNANNTDFPNDFFQYNNLKLGGYLKDGKAGMGSYKNDSKLIGAFGRISYGYANKYNALVSIRREGSSRFGANHKWGTFPSVSLGWTISNEEFMSDLTWLDHLKLRAGMGTTGVIPGSNYLSLLKYDFGSQYFYDDGEWKPGLVVTSNPNPELKWEKSTEYNVGIDVSTLDDRLGGSIDVYRKTTTDMLWNYSVPVPPNLYNTTLANVGEMRNTGIEVAINAVPVRTKDFEWKTTITASHNKNKLLSLSNDLYETANFRVTGWLDAPISQETHYMEVGKELGHFYIMKSVGVSERGVFLIEHPETKEVVELNDAMLDDESYRQDFGSGLPKLFAGWSNQLRYKNFDLSAQFTGQFGFKILNGPRAFYENNAVYLNKMKAVLKAPYGGEYTLSRAQKQAIVSYYLEDGDFLKLSNLTIGYTLQMPKSNYIKSLRVYASGNNLFCITGYSGLDPELDFGNVQAPGIEYRDTYPTTRSFTFGINLGF